MSTHAAQALRTLPAVGGGKYRCEVCRRPHSGGRYQVQAGNRLLSICPTCWPEFVAEFEHRAGRP